MRHVLFAPLLMSAVLLVSACGGDDGDEPSPPGSGGEVVSGGGGDTLPRPPPATASAGGKSVEMGIGSYCWQTACVDMIGHITHGTLSVARGARVSVAVPKGAGEVKEASVIALRAGGQPEKLDSGEEAWPILEGDALNLAATVAGGEVTFTAALQPGRYVVSVLVGVERGDVSYGAVLSIQ